MDAFGHAGTFGRWNYNGRFLVGHGPVPVPLAVSHGIAVGAVSKWYPSVGEVKH